MVKKLVQKHLIHGTQTFELLEDSITITIKKPFSPKKTLSVVLAILNPDPVIENGRLHFHSRVKCGPLMSLYLNKPSRAEFESFVTAVKEAAAKEFGAFSGQM